MEALFRKCAALYLQSVQEVTVHVICLIMYLFTSFYLHFMGPSDPYGYPHIWRRAWCVATPLVSSSVAFVALNQGSSSNGGS